MYIDLGGSFWSCWGTKEQARWPLISSEQGGRCEPDTRSSSVVVVKGVQTYYYYVDACAWSLLSRLFPSLPHERVRTWWKHAQV